MIPFFCHVARIDCGRLCLVTCGRCRTNSLVLSKLIIRPLVSAYLLIWENSSARVQSVFSGTSKLVSSAYLNMTLASQSGRRSLSMISQRVGPIPEPWTMLDVMGCGSENLPSEVLQTWLRPVRKAMIQFRVIGGILRLVIFDNKMEWRTTSNV